jgi:FtsH-binding integral membrane protein
MSYLPTTSAQTTALQRGVMSQIYLWMTAGLLVTGAVASWTATSPGMINLIYGNPFMIWVLLIGQIVMVVALGAGIMRLSTGVATALFLAYAALNGLTLSSIFLVYSQESIAQTFFVTAGTFGAMSLVGYFTKADLSGMGRFLIFALIGLVIGSIVNIFWANSTLYWIITYAGVLIFAGLTAWDTQKLKVLSQQARDEPTARRIALLGALTLYLDFINLFLFLLRIFGGSRNN